MSLFFFLANLFRWQNDYIYTRLSLFAKDQTLIFFTNTPDYVKWHGKTAVIDGQYRESQAWMTLNVL